MSSHLSLISHPRDESNLILQAAGHTLGMRGDVYGPKPSTSTRSLVISASAQQIDTGFGYRVSATGDPWTRIV